MVKIKTSKPEVLWNAKCILGEGTLWVREHKSIYFTDIKKKRIHILNIKNNKSKVIKINKEVGFLANIKKKIFPISFIWNKLLIDKNLYGYESKINFKHVTDIKIYKKLIIK